MSARIINNAVQNRVSALSCFVFPRLLWFEPGYTLYFSLGSCGLENGPAIKCVRRRNLCPCNVNFRFFVLFFCLKIKKKKKERMA